MSLRRLWLSRPCHLGQARRALLRGHGFSGFGEVATVPGAGHGEQHLSPRHALAPPSSIAARGERPYRATGDPVGPTGVVQPGLMFCHLGLLTRIWFQTDANAERLVVAVRHWGRCPAAFTPRHLANAAWAFAELRVLEEEEFQDETCPADGLQQKDDKALTALVALEVLKFKDLPMEVAPEVLSSLLSLGKKNSESPIDKARLDPPGSMAPWLDDIIGDWQDDKGNQYQVRKDEDGTSCSVRTTRKNGHVVLTRSMLKYDMKSDLLMWGRSYYLQTEAYDRSKVYWKPLKNVPPYTWYRRYEEALVEAPSDWNGWVDGDCSVPTLEQVVGSWRDDDGAIYKITMDESGWSCSASIERQDGRRYEARETIKCYADGGLCWADAYFLEPVEGDGSSICWTSIKTGRGFWWESVPDQGAFVVTRSTLQALLAQMVGQWKDEECSVYNVTMDDSGESCTVEIQRPDGRTRVSKGLLKYSTKMESVMWGRSYYLDVQGAGDVVWVHTGQGKSFRWLLVHKSWAQANLEKLVGTWQDQDENLYTVTLDDPAVSCSVQLDRLDGMSRHLQSMLKADSEAKCIWWGAGYSVELAPGWPEVLHWTPSKASKGKQIWQRCSNC
eukprot:s1830_g5.t1